MTTELCVPSVLTEFSSNSFNKKTNKQKTEKDKKNLLVFADWLCVGAVLQNLAMPFTTLLSPSLLACVEPGDQAEMKL